MFKISLVYLYAYLYLRPQWTYTISVTLSTHTFSKELPIWNGLINLFHVNGINVNSLYVWLLVIQHHWVYPCHRMKQYCSSFGCQNSLTSGPDFLSNRRPFNILTPWIILPYTPIIKTQGVFSGPPRLQRKWSKCRQDFFHFGQLCWVLGGQLTIDSRPVACLLVCNYMGIFCSLDLAVLLSLGRAAPNGLQICGMSTCL